MRSFRPRVHWTPQQIARHGAPTRPLPRDAREAAPTVTVAPLLEILPFLAAYPPCSTCGDRATYVIIERGKNARALGNYCDLCLLPAVKRIEQGDRHAS
jgi:hypothetical protein